MRTHRANPAWFNKILPELRAGFALYLWGKVRAVKL